MQDELARKRATQTRSRPADLSVAPLGEQWIVRPAGAPGRGGVYATRDEAVRAAQALTRPNGGRWLMDDGHGSVSEHITLGRAAFEKISAVEGIRLSRAMKRDLRRAAEAATPEAARRMLAEKYGKPAG